MLSFNWVTKGDPQQQTESNPADQVILRRKQDEVDKVSKTLPRYGVNLHWLQETSGDDSIKKASSEKSFDFLEDVSEVFEDEFVAVQRGIPRPRSRISTAMSLTGWAWGPELILGSQVENVYGEVLHNLLQVIKRTGNIYQVYSKRVSQLSNDKYEEFISPNGETKDLRGMGILLSEITNASETQFTFKESFLQYEQLLTIVVDHELRKNVDWRGLLPDWANTILEKFTFHRKLDQSVTDVCSWFVYSTTLHKRTLDFTMLLTLVYRLRQVILNDSLSNKELIDMFWTATDSFTEAALSTIYNLRNISEPEQLSALLESLKELSLMSPTRPGLSNLEGRIKAEITKGAFDWYGRLVREQRKEMKENCDDIQLNNTLCICRALLADMETILNVHEPIFQRVWKISAFSLIYLYYDGQLAEAEPIKPLVYRISQSLESMKPSKEEIISIAFDATGEIDNKDGTKESKAIASQLSAGTSLFELYVCLQELRKLSNFLAETEKNDTKLGLFHSWFKLAANCWLDIGFYKALIRIGKAVSMDNLQTVDNMVKHSSSAVDSATFLYQMKATWERIAWPDVDGAKLAYVARIVENFKQGSLFYAEAIQLKLERIHSGYPSGYFISLQTCSAISNILYVQQFVKPLAEEIGFFKLNDAAQSNIYDGSPKCDPAHDSLTDSAIQDINKKLDKIYIAIAQRFEIQVARLINKAMEANLGVPETDELSSYIWNQLIIFTHLPKVVFFQIFKIIYRHIFQSILNIINEDIQKKQDPAYFRQWEKLLIVVESCFWVPEIELDVLANENEILNRIRWTLKLFGMETSQLILLYQLERAKQTDGPNVDFGSLAVRIIFVDNVLHVNVLNARNLSKNDANGSADQQTLGRKDKKKKKSIDPYVKVQLLPTHHFPDAPILKSKVHKNTLFPLFEENFTFSVPKSLQKSEDCHILFTVKDKNILGTNEFMGESFLCFQQVTRCDNLIDMDQLDQIILPLTKPPGIDSEYFTVLEGRTQDKKACAFVKKVKSSIKSNEEDALIIPSINLFKLFSFSSPERSHNFNKWT